MRNNLKKYLAFLVSITLIVTIFSIFILKGCQKKSYTKLTSTEDGNYRRYNSFVKIWNKYVLKNGLGEDYYLMESNVDHTVNKLNDKLKPFYKEIPGNVEKEFAEIKRNDKYSFFNMYYEFLTEYKARDAELINKSMTSLDIKNVVYKVTKRSSLDKETIFIVASMNDYCYYLKYKEEDLYFKGLDRRIKNCTDIAIDRKKYPYLYNYLSEK
jgi:hypothetical protein